MTFASLTRLMILGAATGAVGLSTHTATAQCSKSTKTAATASTCTAKSSEAVMLGAMGSADIVDTAVKAGQFNTLVAAVQAAGLVDALKSEGPFTVFAPTDAAFAKLSPATLESLLRPENKDMLTSILTFHVVPGRLTAADVTRLSGAKSLEGQRIDFAVDHGKVSINGAMVSAADIGCRNGVIHVIDSVILPASDNIVETAGSAGTFNTLLAAATAAGLADALQGEGPFTVFAPTDDAFAKLPAGTVESLLEPANLHQLADILKYHVVPGRVYAVDAVTAGRGESLLGQELQFDIRGGALYVDNARIVATDIDASNGVIHVIDRVMLPQ